MLPVPVATLPPATCHLPPAEPAWLRVLVPVSTTPSSTEARSLVLAPLLLPVAKLSLALSSGQA